MSKETDQKLTEKLQSLHVPLPDSAAKARAFERARLALRSPESETRRARFHFLSFGLGSALTVALVLLLLPRFYGPTSHPDSTQFAGRGLGETQPGFQTVALSDAAERQVLEETVQLFSGKVAALVRSGGRSEVMLTENTQANHKQPVIIELRIGGETLRILTFSGQTIELELNGNRQRVEILATGEGEVLLTGSDFVWSSTDPSSDELGISARALESLAL